jgi:hypothetical protein
LPVGLAHRVERVKSKEYIPSGKEYIGKYDHVCRGYGSTPFTDTPFTALHPSPFTLHSHTSKEKRVKSKERKRVYRKI